MHLFTIKLIISKQFNLRIYLKDMSKIEFYLVNAFNFQKKVCHLIEYERKKRKKRKWQTRPKTNKNSTKNINVYLFSYRLELYLFK